MESIQERNAHLDGMKVLLVEDTPLNMEIAKFMLEDEGIEVMTAENGQIAVNIFNNSPENTFNAVLNGCENACDGWSDRYKINPDIAKN